MPTKTRKKTAGVRQVRDAGGTRDSGMDVLAMTSQVILALAEGGDTLLQATALVNALEESIRADERAKVEAMFRPDEPGDMLAVCDGCGTCAGYAGASFMNRHHNGCGADGTWRSVTEPYDFDAASQQPDRRSRAATCSGCGANEDALNADGRQLYSCDRCEDRVCSECSVDGTRKGEQVVCDHCDEKAARAARKGEG